MNSIFDLKHKVTVIKRKKVMTCLDHFCDIDSMPEGEYYKQKRLRTSGEDR